MARGYKSSQFVFPLDLHLAHTTCTLHSKPQIEHSPPELDIIEQTQSPHTMADIMVDGRIIGTENEYDVDRTVKQIQQEFDEKMLVWRKSNARSKRLDIVDKKRPREGWHFNRVVFIGGGTCTVRQPACFWHVMMQLVCVLDVAEELVKCGHTGTAGIQVFGQDPNYVRQDREFLAMKRVTVLDMTNSRSLGTDAGKEHVGPRTLFFDLYVCMSPEMAADLYEVRNGLFIGRSPGQMTSDFWDVYGLAKTATDRLTKTMHDFKNDHDSCEFPERNNHGAFHITFMLIRVHWRRTSRWRHWSSEVANFLTSDSYIFDESAGLPRRWWRLMAKCEYYLPKRQKEILEAMRASGRLSPEMAR